ncbi:MAG TPA: hypothetical protein PKA06_09900, partial [Gemmatales bacterium]|nr:hypothetical protein [Gemmatales bacterium]
MANVGMLEAALARGLSPGGDLIHELAQLKDYKIRTAASSHAICLALARLIELPPELPETSLPTRSALDWLIGMFQQVETREAYEVLLLYGMPPLVQLFDERSDRVDLLYLLKLFAMYRLEVGVDRIIQAAQTGLHPEGRLWSVIFRQLDLEHPQADKMMAALRDPLPTGFINIAYLDWVNAFSLADRLSEHPFDTEAGYRLLHKYLTDQNPQRYSYAQSAAASLPFLKHANRKELLALALDHSSTQVQLEGAWASAKMGSSAGVSILSRLCCDPVYSKIACQYLRELELEEAIPRQVQEPEFQARAELIQWLAHPDEFGRPPDDIRLLDTRELYWPPTRDRRQLWLFAYSYDVEEEASEHPNPYQQGVGMVGSITFSLLGKTHPSLAAEDIYALHCCWELEYRGDLRSPQMRDIQAGRRLLAEHQSGFAPQTLSSSVQPAVQ